MSAPSTPTAGGSPAAPATLVTVLRSPEVASTLALSVLSRLPFGALGLLMLLRVSAEHSYAQAGLVDAAYGLSAAACQPLLSRAVDRRGQTAVLVPFCVAGGLATAAFALVPQDSALILFVVLAILNGALQPPLGGTMRAVWDVLLPTPAERHVGYAVDASATEVIWTAGPLVVVGLVAGTFGVTAGMLLCSAFTGLGGLAFAMSGPSRRWRASDVHDNQGTKAAGAFRAPGVQTLVAVTVGGGALFGAIQFGTTAFAKEHGGTGTVGTLLAVWAIGSFLAGLFLTRVPPPAEPARRLTGLLLFLGAGGLVLGLAPSVPVLGVLLALSGAGIAPMFATINIAMGTAAAEGTLTEAYGLTTTGVFVGATASAPVAGLIVDHVSANAALSFSGVPVILMALFVWTRRATLPPVAGHEPVTAPAPAGQRPEPPERSRPAA